MFTNWHFYKLLMTEWSKERSIKCIQNTQKLFIEIQRMWNVKANMIFIIIGATGSLSRSLQKHLDYIPGKHSSLNSIQFNSLFIIFIIFYYLFIYYSLFILIIIIIIIQFL
jgi:hypothetical protein